MRQFVSTSRGLTIIEMMGAMLVSTILLSGVWQLFQGGMRSYQRGLQDVRMTQGARAVLRLVTRDVQRAMAARVPYGIRGATPQSSTLATGEGPADRLALLTRRFPRAFASSPRRSRKASMPSWWGRGHASTLLGSSTAAALKLRRSGHLPVLPSDAYSSPTN